MKKGFLTLIFMFLFFAGCGNIPKFQSATLKSYVDKLQSESCVNVNDVNYVISDAVPDEGNGTGAYCIYIVSLIMVRDIVWETIYNDIDKEAWLLHEFGHCVLSKGHDNEKDGDMPISYLHENFVGYIGINKDIWESELKQHYYKKFYDDAKIQGKIIKDCTPIFE
jgi:hypothetical protein